MRRLRRERHRADVADAARTIRAFEIALDDALAVPEHDQPMDIPKAPLSKRLIEPPGNACGEGIAIRGRSKVPRLLSRDGQHLRRDGHGSQS